MKTQKIEIILKVLFFAVIVFISTIIVQSIINRCTNTSAALVEYDRTKEKQINLEQVKIWKDKYNKEHFLLEKERLNKEVFERQADSMARLLNIKSKQIKQVSHIKTQVVLSEKLKTIYKTDTIKIGEKSQVINYTDFTFKDNWIDIRGNVGKNDSIYIKGSDTLIRVDYVKRKWLLGRKRYYTDFSNKNPYIHIKGLKEVELVRKRENWSVGPFVGIGLIYGHKVEFKPTVGVSLQYSLIRF